MQVMKGRVYVETTVPSYLTAWPSRDLVRAAQQQVRREWWNARAAFDLFISPLVLVECQAGDPSAAADRLAALAGLPLLDQTEEVVALAEPWRGLCRSHHGRRPMLSTSQRRQSTGCSTC